MHRIPVLAVAALATLPLLAACADDEGSGRPAAVVNGIEISQQDLVDELEAIEGNRDYLQAYESSATAQGQPPIRGDEEGSFDAAFVATALGLRIQYALVEAEVADRGLEADPACADAAQATLVNRFAGASSDGDGQAVLDAFGDDYAGYLLDRETDFNLLQADLSGLPCGEGPSDEAIQAYFDEHESELAVETACVSHILVATEAEAQEIAGLLAGGADFAQLASERSTDTGSAANGGDLGCGPAGRFVDAFDAAAFSQPVGEVGPPVQTEFGFHLILVTERSVQTVDDARPQIEQALQQQAQDAFISWFTDALAEGEVDVDPRYGTWDATQAEIVRPTDPGAGEDASAGG